MPTTARTVRLKESTSESIDRIADICGRDANFVMREAIEEYVSHHEWVIQETQRRLDKLENGQAELTSHGDVWNSIQKRQ